MEKDNLNLESKIEQIISELLNGKFKGICESYKNQETENYDNGFIETDIPKDFNSRKKISPVDIKAVRDDEDVTEVRGIIPLFVEIDDDEKKINITANIGKNRIEFSIQRQEKFLESFLLNTEIRKNFSERLQSYTALH